MGTDRLGRQHISWITCFLVYACFYSYLLPPAQAEQTSHNRDTQKREAVRHAIELAQPSAELDGLQMSERDDLDDELSQIAPKTTGLVSFYSFYDIDSSSDEGSLWVVIPGDSALGSDELFGFESSDSLGQSSEKFNRLLSHLALSVPNDKAASIARLFLGCCVRDTYGETVSDEGVLRHTVERYYIRIYGDVWRGLEAYTQWWQAYQKEAVRFAANGRGRRGRSANHPGKTDIGFWNASATGAMGDCSFLQRQRACVGRGLGLPEAKPLALLRLPLHC